jgi:hypothetical protein
MYKMAFHPRSVLPMSVSRCASRDTRRPPFLGYPAGYLYDVLPILII